MLLIRSLEVVFLLTLKIIDDRFVEFVIKFRKGPIYVFRTVAIIINSEVSAENSFYGLLPVFREGYFR